METGIALPETFKPRIDGDGPDSLSHLVPLLYSELRAIAHRQLRRERADHTLSTTGLVHEAYLRLIDQHCLDWRDRAQFFALSARMMRRVLVDYSRRRGAQKREGGRDAVWLEDAMFAADTQADLIVALDDAVSRLALLDERQARVVEYRFFGGFTEEETAELLGISSRTVRNDWVKAKGWLYRELRDES